MNKTDLEYEMIIKGLIDFNLKSYRGKTEDTTHHSIMFGGEWIQINLHWGTEREVILNYFYDRIAGKN